MIELCNETVRVEIEPEIGAELRFVGRPDGRNVLFYEPWQTPVPARESMAYGSSVSDALSSYRGGWQEMFPNAGQECEVMGVPLPFHGEGFASAWELVAHEQERAVLRLRSRLPLLLERVVELGDGRVLLRETLVNDSRLPVPYVWGHHPAFRSTPEALIDLPAEELVVDPMEGPVDLAPGARARWPQAPGLDGRSVDLRKRVPGPLLRVCYLPDLPAGWAALRYPSERLGVALSWDLAMFPHLWLWENIAQADFPWYGRSSIVALEPNSSWPAAGLATAIENGRAHLLEPGGSAETWITLSLFAASDRAVVGVDREGNVSTAA